jgi:hypothetical protein
MRFAGLLLIAATSTCLAGEYEFPAGVPVRVKDVTFYEATDHYQMLGSLSSGVHNRTYNISADKPRERFGNPNLELPWKTGGLDDCPNAGSYKFYRLPPDGSITYWRDGRGAYQWRYPDGTLFGEVLTVDDATFEVRTMVKHEGEWQFHVYRPFGQRSEIEEFIVAEETKADRLRNEHPVRIIDEVALADDVELKPEAVQQVLARPFREVTDVVFAESESGKRCYAPTASKQGQIVPVRYQGGFFHGQTCVQCHQTVGKSADELQPGRDWYGVVRGSDSVLSFSIFDDRCASRNGISQPVILRSDLPLEPAR